VEKVRFLTERVAKRKQALQQLRRYIAENAREQKFQTLFVSHPWMLGARYTRLVQRRDWTERHIVDLLFQTEDQYFELVELKRSRPQNGCFKTNRERTIVSAPVNDAMNQAAHYLAEIEARRDNLLRNYGVDLFKLRARVVIGYIQTGHQSEMEQREALRMYNSHLNRITVISYDEVERICERVIESQFGKSETAQSPQGQEPLCIGS